MLNLYKKQAALLLVFLIIFVYNISLSIAAQISNLNILYEPLVLNVNNQTIGGSVSDSQANFSIDNPATIGIFEKTSERLISSLNLDMSGANIDWGNLTVENSLYHDRVFIGAPGGVSSLSGSLSGANLFVRRNAGIRSNQLTNDNSFSQDFWGNALKIDDNNNIVLSAYGHGVNAYIWRNPSTFAANTVDEVVLVSNNYDYTTNSLNSSSVAKLGNNKFLIAWMVIPNFTPLEPRSIVGKIIDNDGNFVTSDIIINSDPTCINSCRLDEPKISEVGNGKVIVTWTRRDYNTNDQKAYAQVLNSLTGDLIGSPFLINDITHQADDPDVTILSDGRYAFVYWEKTIEQVYYRIWDPNTSDFESAPIKIEIGNVDFAGYFQRIVADESGGFAVFFGGYFDDGNDYFDRVYLQIFDANETPLYQNINDMVISNDSTTQWYWDIMGLDYYKGKYHLAWDTAYGNNYSGMAYRIVDQNGAKENAIIIDEVYEAKFMYSITMDLDRNGVPIMAWPVVNTVVNPLNLGNWVIFGSWTPIPKQNPDRVGICSLATLLSEVNNTCSGLVYKSIGDIDFGLSYPEGSIGGSVDYMVTNVENGGAFLDAVPSFAFKDFNMSGEVTNSLNVNWYDTEDVGGGEISFYYDNDNSGFDGTLIQSNLDASSLTNNASLKITSLPGGTFWLYAIIDDGYYDPMYVYSDEVFIKTAPPTPTPSPTIIPTSTPTLIATNTPTLVVTSTAIPTINPTGVIDNIGPEKVVITNIGLIDNIINADSILYYFTSQTPLIKGNAEALSTVHFINNSKDYFTQADNNGRFSLLISNPILPNGTNDLIYYATDYLGNSSLQRSLRLVIGEANFPDWLIAKLNGYALPTATITPTSNIVTITPVVSATIINTPTVTPTFVKISSLPETGSRVINTVTIIVKDQSGNSLNNVDVKINGILKTTDSKGVITIRSFSEGDYNVEYNGLVQGIQLSVENPNVNVFFATTANTPGSMDQTIKYLLIGTAGLFGIVIVSYIVKKFVFNS